MNTIAIIIIMSSIFSATANLSVLKYKQKGRSPIGAGTYDFPVIEEDNNGKDVKRYKSVNIWDGHPKSIRQAIRDTYEPFREVATACGWSEEQMMKEFRTNVMDGDGKEKFDEALEEDDIDYHSPDADDFELTLANLLTIAAEHKYPANKVDVYLRELTLEYALTEYGHKPTVYLRERKAIERANDELQRIDGTQPSEAARKEEFIQSLGEENLHWLFEVDRGDRDNMTREDIADRLDAHLKKEVEEAQKKVKSRKGGGGSGNGDSSERSGDSSKRFGKRKRGGRSDRNGGGKRARTPRDNEPCPFHNGSHDFGKCAASPFKSNNNYDEWACKKILGRKDIEKDHPWYVKACKYHRGLELSDGVRFHNGKPVSRDGSPLGRDNGDRRQGRDRRDRGRPRGGRGGGDQNQHGRGDSNNNNSTQQQFQFAPPAGMPPLPVGSTIQILPPLPAPPTSNRGVSFAFGRQPSAPATTQQASGGGRWVLNSQGVYQPI